MLDQVRAAFATGWDALGDLRQQVTVRHIVRNAYQPGTGNVPQQVTIATPLAVLVDYETDLIDGTDIRSGDLRCILRSAEVGFSIEQGDTVDLDNGERWTVVRDRGDRYNPKIYNDLTLRR
jgi:hypothetical protein